MGKVQANSSNDKGGFAWVVLIGTILIYFGGIGITANCISVFWSPVATDLGFSITDMSLYITVMTVSQLLFQSFARKMVMKYDPRMIYIIASAIMCAAMAAMSFYTQPWMWWLMGIPIGFAHAFITFNLAPLVLYNWFKIQYSTACGISLAFTGVGGALFAPITSSIIAGSGWHSAYLIMALISFVICVIGSLLLRGEPEKCGKHAWGWNKMVENVQADEARMNIGYTFKEALRAPAYYLCIITIMLIAFACNFQPQVTTFGVSLGMDIQAASLMATCISVGSIVGKPLLGVINDKFGVRVMSVFGSLFALVGLIILIMTAATSNTGAYIGMFIFGVGFSLLTVALPFITRPVVGEKCFRQLYSYVASSLNLVSAVSAAIYASILDATGSYFPGLYVAMACIVISCIITIIITKKQEVRWAKELEAVSAAPSSN